MQTTLSNLEQAYNIDDFRSWGHQLIDLLADHLSQLRTAPNETPAIPYRRPEEELAFWQNDLANTAAPLDFFRNVLQHSVQVHHPHYMGHQVSVPALVASLAGLLSDTLSNGTGVYEMGMASNALEKIVTDQVAQQIGYDHQSTGLLTSGGTLANLTALLAARKAQAPTDVWEQGHAEQLAIMVSEEAHYCIDRAARIMGLGSQGIIKVPVNAHFEIRTDLLEAHLQQAQRQGLTVIAVVGCAASTSTGSYDDLHALADFCERHRLWLHVDGAHGGAVVFSDTYRHLATGIERADSVVIDFHKMLLTPALNTALIFKKGHHADQTFAQRAQYLWDTQHAGEWYNSGKRTFECTKLMLSVKVYSLLKTFGPSIFAENVNRLYDLGQRFAAIIRQRPAFELAVAPTGNIVNFRYVAAPEPILDRLNNAIRQALLESGNFYIVQTVLHGKRYLRTALMNPLTTEANLKQLLDAAEQHAHRLIANTIPDA
ncbi:MAG TPA: aminotransferase class I/II-fold pyridoxal phosphate-dependent enzyme [Saprospiraceae bacterium]|nr:aminotransferase class I/II-fold pyridoxal phosphate-dependent enzyme [Saprospiraceae bacterium]HMP24635.1 aminotransferase class I/II-fold pyridoxal phosphate-dependent enzyme [Saprospiraceae bacterium]